MKIKGKEKMRKTCFKLIIFLLIVFYVAINPASFNFKSAGISIYPAFSTDGMHRWFNTKFEVDWEINDWMELESSIVFLKVNTSYDKELLFKEVWLFTSVITNLKFQLPYNFKAGAGFGLHYTNFSHYNLDETYAKWNPGINVSVEYYIPWKNPWPILCLSKIEFMYFFIPLNLTETSFNDHYYSNILTLSIHFNIFGGKR